MVEEVALEFAGEDAHLVRHVPALERALAAVARDEFLRDLKEGAANPSLRLMLETGILFSIFPEFVRAFGERNPLRDRAQRSLQALFGLVDQLVGTGRPVPDSMLLALLVTPLLQAVSPEHPHLGEKERSVYRAQTIRFVLHQSLIPCSIPRGTKEAAAQILIAQSNLRKSLRHGLISRRLRTKRYFQEAALYLGIEAQAKGEKVPHMLRRALPQDFLPWWPKEPRRGSFR